MNGTEKLLKEAESLFVIKGASSADCGGMIWRLVEIVKRQREALIRMADNKTCGCASHVWARSTLKDCNAIAEDK